MQQIKVYIKKYGVVKKRVDRSGKGISTFNEW